MAGKLERKKKPIARCLKNLKERLMIALRGEHRGEDSVRRKIFVQTVFLGEFCSRKLPTISSVGLTMRNKCEFARCKWTGWIQKRFWPNHSRMERIYHSILPETRLKSAALITSLESGKYWSLDFYFLQVLLILSTSLHPNCLLLFIM